MNKGIIEMLIAVLALIISLPFMTTVGGKMYPVIIITWAFSVLYFPTAIVAMLHNSELYKRKRDWILRSLFWPVTIWLSIPPKHLWPKK
jgi:hypothetical protein